MQATDERFVPVRLVQWAIDTDARSRRAGLRGERILESR